MASMTSGRSIHGAWATPSSVSSRALGSRRAQARAPAYGALRSAVPCTIGAGAVDPGEVGVGWGGAPKRRLDVRRTVTHEGALVGQRAAAPVGDARGQRRIGNVEVLQHRPERPASCIGIAGRRRPLERREARENSRRRGVGRWQGSRRDIRRGRRQQHQAADALRVRGRVERGHDPEVRMGDQVDAIAAEAAAHRSRGGPRPVWRAAGQPRLVGDRIEEAPRFRTS